jgi:hypothetical protein
MPTTTNYGWTTPADTDLVKDGASAIRTLGSAIDSTLKTQIDAQIPDSLLTTTGDTIYASGASTPARLAVGSTGQYLSVSGGVPAWSTLPVSKNAVINGGMDVWQRGTSFNAGGATNYSADRYAFVRGANTSAVTCSRQVTGDTTNLPNIQYAARIQRTASNTSTDTVFFAQSFESVNSIPFAGKTISFSFYARAGANYSAASSNLSFQVISGTGTDQNVYSGFTGASALINTTATLTTTWQRFTYTGTVASTATQLGFYFYYAPVGTAGAADYFEVTGVQLEVGSIATPFQRQGSSIQAELAACQRYYLNLTQNATCALGVISYYNSTAVHLGVSFPVEMRTAPSIYQVSGASYFAVYNGGASRTISAGWNIAEPNTRSCRMYVDSTAAATGQAGFAYLNNAAAVLALTAEL